MEFKESDACLNYMERCNVSAAYEMIDAMHKCWIEPRAGRVWLERLLAEDFVSFTPTSDPDRQQLLDKPAFIDGVRNQGLRLKPTSRMHIVAHTAHGNRVATEMSSELVWEDGSPVRNRYHQLFLLDSASKITQYRTYMDSAAIIDSAIVRGEALVRHFVVALGSASSDLKKLTTKHFEYHAADGSVSIGADQLLVKLASIRDKVSEFTLDIIEDGLVIEPGIASVEAQTPNGFVHSLIVRFDDNYVTSAIEFSSGILEVHP
jgi:ketosteroid isomerase-like protein